MNGLDHLARLRNEARSEGLENVANLCVDELAAIRFQGVIEHNENNVIEALKKVGLI